MSHKGSCKCKAVSFEVRGEILWSGYCHCHDCRKATSAPVSAFVIFKKEDVHWTGSKPKVYQSSEKVTRTFCEMCGSPVAYQTTDAPERIDLYTGLFEDAETLLPTDHIWTASKLPWLNIQDNLPRREGA